MGQYPRFRVSGLRVEGFGFVGLRSKASSASSLVLNQAYQGRTWRPLGVTRFRAKGLVLRV